MSLLLEIWVFLLDTAGLGAGIEPNGLGAGIEPNG